MSWLAGRYDGSTFEEFWNTNCHQEYKRSLALFTLAVPFFLAKLIVISFIKFKHWGFGVGLSASCIVFVGFVVWARTNLTWVCRPFLGCGLTAALDSHHWW